MKTIIPLHGLADCFYHHPRVQLHIDKNNIGYTRVSLKQQLQSTPTPKQISTTYSNKKYVYINIVTSKEAENYWLNSKSEGIKGSP